MTAKRFSVNMENYVLDNVTGKRYVADNNIDANLIRDLLNELHEENMMLKGEVAHYKLILMSLEKEAKRLSQIR